MSWFDKEICQNAMCELVMSAIKGSLGIILITLEEVEEIDNLRKLALFVTSEAP